MVDGWIKHLLSLPESTTVIHNSTGKMFCGALKQKLNCSGIILHIVLPNGEARWREHHYLGFTNHRGGEVNQIVLLDDVILSVLHLQPRNLLLLPGSGWKQLRDSCLIILKPSLVLISSVWHVWRVFMIFTFQCHHSGFEIKPSRCDQSVTNTFGFTVWL